MNYSFALRENIYGIILLYSIVSKHIYQQYSSSTLITRKQKRIEIFIWLGKQLFMSNKCIFPALSHFLLPIDIKQVDGSGLTVHTYLGESANSRHIIDILWQPRKNNQKE